MFTKKFLHDLWLRLKDTPATSWKSNCCQIGRYTKEITAFSHRLPGDKCSITVLVVEYSAVYSQVPWLNCNAQTRRHHSFCLEHWHLHTETDCLHQQLPLTRYWKIPCSWKTVTRNGTVSLCEYACHRWHQYSEAAATTMLFCFLHAHNKLLHVYVRKCSFYANFASLTLLNDRCAIVFADRYDCKSEPLRHSLAK